MKNLGKTVLRAVTAVIMLLVAGGIIGYNMKEEQIKNQKPHIETGYNPTDPVTAERPATYSRTIVREFHPGDTLTSNESGAWILWDSTMSKELQVAYVTDSGTIKILK